MTVRELREKYLAFFESKGHSRHPSAPLVPYDVTGRLDESLLFTGAGMVQFKPYFRGVARPENPKLITCQKCVRTGDIESVGDPNHLTFFEMLGNFSFGDYFKAQAIAYSWEFLTSKEWLGLDPKRLAFTVFEEDDEAFDEWTRWLIPAGIEPSNRVFRLGEETNYWPAGAFSGGPPGPCGPNSEMFYWVPSDTPPPSGTYTRDQFVQDEAAGKWLEIWNDVFIQFEWEGHLRNPERPSDGWLKDGMPPLPFQSVDTGMGLERTTVSLSGLHSVYQTDAFLPIFRVLSEIASSQEPPRPSGEEGAEGEEVRSALAAMSRAEIPSEGNVVRAARIIADHIRTAVFCIADGVLPGNTGRGYVLRRLIRRAVLKGQRQLGFEDSFLFRVCEGVVEAMGSHYPELHERRDVIVETLRNEEALFTRTLREGFNVMTQFLSSGQRAVFPGDAAFQLYDTYGFPLEVTQELAAESGLKVDIEGYERALKEAQQRSRATGGQDTVYGGVSIRFQFTIQTDDGRPTPTIFTGYDECATRARIVGALPAVSSTSQPPNTAHEPSPRELVIALDRTPFYAASGGQVSDTGTIKGEGFELKVVDVLKQDEVYVHLVESKKPLEPEQLFNPEVTAMVDEKRRAAIRRNHTATHLLHAALRCVLGKHVTQAGSYVGPDRLRFDFTHGKAMTPQELSEVEKIVNEKSLQNELVRTYVDVPVAEAKKMGAMALFGEKYGNSVRVVQIGDMQPGEESFSRELCGGTHVRSTGEIGLFKIVSESSAASGVRRIEAVTGEGAYEWALEQEKSLKDAAALIKANPSELPRAVKALQDLAGEERRKREKAERALVQGGAVSDKAAAFVEVGPFQLWTPSYEEVDQKIVAGAVDDAVAKNPLLVVIAGLRENGRATFVAKVGKDAQAKGAHAGKLVSEVAKIAGGGGGGRPDFATAGGKQPEKLEEALAAAERILRQMVGH